MGESLTRLLDALVIRRFWPSPFDVIELSNMSARLANLENSQYVTNMRNNHIISPSRLDSYFSDENAGL
jgi:hypothetical protein